MKTWKVFGLRVRAFLFIRLDKLSANTKLNYPKETKEA